MIWGPNVALHYRLTSFNSHSEVKSLGTSEGFGLSVVVLSPSLATYGMNSSFLPFLFVCLMVKHVLWQVEGPLRLLFSHQDCVFAALSHWHPFWIHLLM